MQNRCILIMALFAISVCAQESSEDKLTPTQDSKSKTGVYIPKNLEDSSKELDRMLPAEVRDKMKFRSEDQMLSYHFGLGMWLRNNWGLWHGSRLSKCFSKLGVKHRDDMSAIILNSYWRHLNGKPLELGRQVAHYKEAEKALREKLRQ